MPARDLRHRLGSAPKAATWRRRCKPTGTPEAVGEGSFSLPDDAPFNGDGQGTPYAMRTWGAIFLEVGVDPEFGLVRLRRAVAAYSAGRIINPLTARSQITGGIIFGWGKATMEESMQEPIHGRWLAKNLSNTAIPVNADIPADLTVHFVDEYDEHASAIGAKGIGELGATGVDAAVAAAVHDAVGVRSGPADPAGQDPRGAGGTTGGSVELGSNGLARRPGWRERAVGVEPAGSSSDRGSARSEGGQQLALELQPDFLLRQPPALDDEGVLGPLAQGA